MYNKPIEFVSQPNDEGISTCIKMFLNEKGENVKKTNGFSCAVDQLQNKTFCESLLPTTHRKKEKKNPKEGNIKFIKRTMEQKKIPLKKSPNAKNPTHLFISKKKT